MENGRPYRPRGLSSELTGEIDRFLADHELQDLYRTYSWRNDTFKRGFPDILQLERRLVRRRKSANLDIEDIRKVADWGRLPNRKRISVKDTGRLRILALRLNGAQSENETIIAREPEMPAGLLDNAVTGIGATYVSKVLRFTLPEQYGAIDTRLVRVLGNGDPINSRFDWLPLTADTSNGRWAISLASWTQGYKVWINILRYFANALPDSCPHPESFYRHELRQDGIWTCADVEMALFSYATGVTNDSKEPLSSSTKRRYVDPPARHKSPGSTSVSRYSNRQRPCPDCGAGIGQACKYPSGHIYPDGHRSRGRPPVELRNANRRYPCPKCGAGVGEVCKYPSGFRYEQGHSQRTGYM